jgi:hypothetical protein
MERWTKSGKVRYQPPANRQPRTPQRQHQAPSNRNEKPPDASLFLTDEEMAESPTPSDVDQLYDNADISSSSSPRGISDAQYIGWEGERSGPGDATPPITIPRVMSTQEMVEDETRVATITTLPRLWEASGIGPAQTRDDDVRGFGQGERDSVPVEDAGERQTDLDSSGGSEGSAIVERDADVDLTDALAGIGMDWKESVEENFKEKGGRSC